MSYISTLPINDDVLVWERDENGRTTKTYRSPYYFYTKSKKGEYTSMYGDKLTRHVFATGEEFRQARNKYRSDRVEMFESDIPVDLKILSEKYYNVPAPVLHVTFLDIEVDYSKDEGFAKVENPYAPINSVALYHTHLKKYTVLAIPPNLAPHDSNNDDWIIGNAPEDFMKRMHEIAEFQSEVELEVIFCVNETELLMRFLVEIEDSDVVCGWNSDFFDIPYIGKRLQKLGKRHLRKLSFPEGAPPSWRVVEKFGTESETLDLSGRISADYMVLFRKYEMAERPSYKLESIADEMLPDLPKLEYEGSLAALYRKDFAWFVRYNIRDTEILHGLEDRLGYVDLANQMMHMSTGLFKHVTGTLKLAELATINYCHHELGGLIVNDVRMEENDSQIQGAFVLLPQVGMHEYVSSVDIASLYPSAIRSINISPETLIGQMETVDYEELTPTETKIAIDFYENKSKDKTKLSEKNRETLMGQEITDVVSFVRHVTEIKSTKQVYAAEAIARGDDTPVIFTMEDGQSIEAPAATFRKLLKKQNWAISGYGTIFDQNKQGIIPMILSDWYAQRKKYKREMAKAKDAGDKIKATYYDKLQYVYKIKLNSFYGALTNAFFRFYDLRMGESTTGTGRQILLHQCAKACEVLDGKYQDPNNIILDRKIKKGWLNIKWHFGYDNDSSVVYGDSVANNTKIETKEGPTIIEKLFTTVDYKKGEKEYSNCNKQALTYIDDTKTNEFRPIKYVVRHKVHKKMYRVWIGNTRYLDVTEDHSLMGYANSKHKTPGLIEIPPTSIGTNNVNSLILNSFLPQTTKQNPFQLSTEMWQLIGLVIGDGHVERRRRSGVGLSLGRLDKSEIIKKIINPLIQQGWFTSLTHTKNGHDIRLTGTKGYDFLKHNLYPNGTKQFPDWIFKCYIQDIEKVLQGYFSADGFANKNKTIGLCSVNNDFIETTNRLLKMCGIPSNYWTEKTENSFKGKFSNTYTKRLTVYDAVKFGKQIGFIQDRKNKNIRHCYSKNTQHCLDQSGYTLISPTKIEEIEYDDYVYDIEVDDTHMFYANDLLVHNTDSSYFLTHTDDTKDATAVGNEVAKKINGSFKEFMQEKYLCQPEFDNIISCEREVVSDRGIFVDKKRYILHLVDQDGWPVDKMKVMGLDTKKTTLPKEVSIVLNQFIERLLRGEQWDSIAEDMVEYKDHLTTTNDIMSIGLPKGVKNVKEYTEALIEHGEGARLPGHVAAAIFYNICRKKFQDKESMPISSGMKIKVFYLSQNVGRFKSIALPVDIEQIPQWFLDEFVVNRKMHVERLIDNPLNNIVKAIKKTVPNRQDLVVNSLLEF